MHFLNALDRDVEKVIRKKPCSKRPARIVGTGAQMSHLVGTFLALVGAAHGQLESASQAASLPVLNLARRKRGSCRGRFQ
jgi:hypothetical protein